MIRSTHRSGGNITSAMYLVLLVVFHFLLQSTHAAPKTEADIRRFANGLQVDEEMVRKAFNSLDTVTNFEQQQFNSSRKLESSCETFRKVAGALTHYRQPITCEFSPDDTTPPARTARYLDDEMIPFLELLRSLGFTYLAEKTDACIPPTYVADLLKDAVFSSLSPCYRLQKSKSLDLSRNGSIIDILFQGAKRLSKIPVVGKWFRIFSVPLRRVSKMWKEKIEEPTNRKCNKMSDNTRDFIEKLDSYITKYQIYMDRFINFLSYERLALCGLVNMSPDRTSNRMLRILESQKNISIATDMEQHRFLAYNPKLVDLTPLHEVEEVMSEITEIMNDFGQTFNIFVQSVDNAFDDVNAILDQSVLPKVMPELSKVANIIDKISSKLKFLQCPSKGFFGFICNLDSLIADMVNKILKKIGIDIDDMIGDIVENILNPILKIPDLTELIPNFDFLGNVLNVDDTLLRPIKEKFDKIGEKLEGFDILGDSISYSGVPDLELDVIGAIEYLYSKGSLNSAKLECVESETFPYALNVVQRNKCGINDVTRFFDLPCGFDSTCDVDMSSFVNDLPSCPSQGLISDIGVESSNILYICITKDQFENFSGMPAQHLQYLDEEDYECPTDFHEKLYIGDLQGKDKQRQLCPVAKLDTCLVPIRDITDLSSNTNVAFHVGVTVSTTFNFHFNPRYEYGNCFFSALSQQFSRDPSLDKLVMECPANHIIRVDEVAHDVTLYMANYPSNEIYQKFRSSDSADENVFSTSNAKDLCNNKNNCEFSADDLFKYRDIGIAIVTYRASYECLELCPAGHALLPNGAGSCIPCGAGFYRDDSMSTCRPCATGTFNINETASICTSCPIGSFNSIKGHKECTVCEPGYVTTDEGSSSSDDCIPCEAGEFSTVDGLCNKCPPGTTSTTGSFDCFDVPPGSFNNGTGVQVCPPGSFTDEEGAIECNPCEEGSYTRDFNSDECAFCNIGTYQDEKGESSCKVCPNGKVTNNLGALSEDECQPAPTPVQYSSLEFNGSKCEDILSFDLVSNPNLTEEEKAAILQQRLMQVGDGICNNGPWNTMQCDFDGGDCCPQTCVVPNNATEPYVETIIDEDGIEIYVVPDLSIIPDIKYISEQSCKQSTFSCLDPRYAGEPITTTCPISNSPSSGDSSTMCELDLSITTNARKGDGLCDSCLNTEEHDFDGGDCCPQTCEVNPAFVDSCLHFCECKQTHLVDTTPPQLFFEKKPDSEITVPVKSIPEPPLVFATDNVPNGFDPTIQFIETRGKMLCSNMYTLLRKWTAVDGAGNPTTATSTIHVADFFPPIISNTDSIGAVTCLMAKEMKFNPPNITFPFMTIKHAMLELDHDVKDDCGSSGVEYCDTTVNPILMGCEKRSSLDTSTEVEEEVSCNIDYDDLITLHLDYEAICKGGDKSKSGSNDSKKNTKSVRSVRSKKDKKCKTTRAAVTHHFDIMIGFDDECGNTSVGNLTRKIMVVWPSKKEGTTPPDVCDSVYYFNEKGKLQVD